MRGRGIEHISHKCRAGWLRNVHAAHGIELGAFLVVVTGGRADGEGNKEGDDDEGDGMAEGREYDDESELSLVWVCLTGKGIELRGTPHREHTRAAVGLKPGGFLFPHTSHSQLSNALCSSCEDDSPVPNTDSFDVLSAPALEEAK